MEKKVIVEGKISIHASHAGCDTIHTCSANSGIDFNPRIPCGMRLLSCFDSTPQYLFQSTHPMRDATKNPGTGDVCSIFQSTHPMRDATDSLPILAPSDVFQSTHPMRDATKREVENVLANLFQSTHPMRDATTYSSYYGCNPNFNPRIPCGMRLSVARKANTRKVFQSTHPMRDATMKRVWLIPFI